MVQPLLVALLFALPGAPSLRAAAQEPAIEDPRTIEQRRVLMLDDGESVRGRTRWDGVAWQLKRKREWLPVEGVTAVHVEREILAEAKAMGREAKDAGSAGRLLVAAWMLERGLAVEALGELDHVLREDPENADVRRLLRKAFVPDRALVDGAPPVDLSGWTGVLLRARPAAREAIAWRVALLHRADLRAIDQRVEGPGVESSPTRLEVALRLQMLQRNYERRAAAAFLARRLVPDAMRRDLLDRAVLDVIRDVREEASMALREARDAAAIAQVVDALGSKNAGLRRNAAEVLGAAGYAAAVEPLISHLAHLQSTSSGGPSGVRANLFVGFQTAYVRDYDVEIAQAASIADPQVGVQSSGVAFDVRAQAQISRTVTPALEARSVARALERLTGEKRLGASARRWTDWWNR